MEWFVSLMILIYFALAGIVIAAVVKKNRQKRSVSSDGHIIPRQEDVTCRKYGHHHPGLDQMEQDGHRYIVHTEVESGYVILNGVKRKLTDCKDL